MQSDSSSVTADDPTAALARGWFYAIQLDPTFAPRQIKLGWTQNLTNRLKAHQTAAPRARLLWHWPCPRDVEAPAIRAIATGRARYEGGEVYEFYELTEIPAYADAFFAGVAATLPLRVRRQKRIEAERRANERGSGIRQVRPGYFQGRVAAGGRRYSVSGTDRLAVAAKLAALRLQMRDAAVDGPSTAGV